MRIFCTLLLAISLVHCTSPTAARSQKNEQGSQIEDVESPEDRNSEFRVAVISDMNRSYGSTTYSKPVSQAIEYISNKKNKVDFVISTGDMVAGQKTGLNYQAMWKAFHGTVTKPLNKSSIPILPSPGNHDAHAARSIERDHYSKSWMRQESNRYFEKVQLIPGVKQNYPFQYAFMRGSVLFVSLDNTRVGPWKSEMVDWIQKVLETAKDAKVKVLYGHVPLLPFSVNKETEYVARGNVDFLNDIEALFEAHKVDVFLSGHSHVYYPGRRDQFTEYISVPLLGSGPRRLLSTRKLKVSQRGFLVLNFKANGEWSVEHRSANGQDLIDDESFPEAIRIPASNSKLCKRCKNFPKTHFLQRDQRIIYKRRDL